jgi:hypothetical protein
MNIEDFKTAGEWYRRMKKDEYTVPLALYYALVKLMDDKRIPFAVAYRELLDQGKIKIINKNVIFDL